MAILLLGLALHTGEPLLKQFILAAPLGTALLS
jgi:hypothetical protein